MLFLSYLWVRSRNSLEVDVKTQQIKAAGTPLTQLVSMCGVSIVVVFALLQVQAGLLTMGEFTTILSAMLLLLPPIKHLSNVMGSTAAMTAAAESLFKMVDEVPEKDEGTQDVKRIHGAVSFDHVGFTYPSAEKVTLKNFTLEVKPGEMIALVGSSGAGKSTLINLIPRFWNPTEGQIYFDGIPQQDFTLESLRRQIALVSQDVVIFDDTLRNNLTYGLDNVTDEQLQEAIEAASLTDMIAELPEGLETRTGEGGSLFSGGQKQRISIARAFLRNAPILIMDEATSALDSKTERHVAEAMDRLRSGRTCIIVAHRLSTIAGVDRIVVMKDGRIVEMGSYDELLSKQANFARLVELQAKA